MRIAAWNGIANMERCPELEKCRMKIWNRFITLRALYNIEISFDEFWYEFLVRYMVLEDPSLESVSDEICTAIEKRIAY